VYLPRIKDSYRVNAVMNTDLGRTLKDTRSLPFVQTEVTKRDKSISHSLKKTQNPNPPTTFE
jgi:hypothetical protein